MTSSDDELSPEDQAALDAWEEQTANAPEPPPSRAAELTRQFSDKPEIRVLRETTQGILDRVDGEEIAIPITLPKAFIEMVEFIERGAAAAAGRAPHTAADIIRQKVMNDLHADLHRLSTEPGSFAYYRKLWNDFCDERGAPDEKIPEPK